MPSEASLSAIILPPWRTNARATALLVGRLPASIWDQAVPGAPRRTPGMIAGHIHNARCRWLRTLGEPQGLAVPRPVDRRTATRVELVRALRHSAKGIEDLLILGCDRGGWVPATAAYSWRNLALDVGHILTYFVAHEAHHRGQLLLLTRQLEARLPSDIVNCLWQWKPPGPRRRARRH